MASELSSLIDKQLRTYEDVEKGKGQYSSKARSSHSSETLLKTFARQRRMLLAALVSLTLVMAMYTAYSSFGSVQPKEIVFVESERNVATVQVDDFTLQLADAANTEAERREEAFELQEERIEVEEARLEQQEESIDAKLQIEEELAREVAEAEAEVVDTLEAELAGADLKDAMMQKKDASSDPMIVEQDPMIVEMEAIDAADEALGEAVLDGEAFSEDNVVESNVEQQLLQAEIEAEEAAIEDAIESQGEVFVEERTDASSLATQLDAIENKIIGEDRAAIDEQRVETALDSLLNDEDNAMVEEATLVEDRVDDSLEEAMLDGEGGL